jgi:Ca2+-binding RTX toxin-like protein
MFVSDSPVDGAPFGLAVNATQIYWANTATNTNGIADADGTSPAPTSIDAGDFPAGVAVDAKSSSCAGREATVVGTGRSDRLRGAYGEDVIAAGGGDDTVAGLRGDDTICGARGHDEIGGKRGDDTLRGGRGKDELRGGRGSDGCRGGGGSDDKHRCE